MWVGLPPMLYREDDDRVGHCDPRSDAGETDGIGLVVDGLPLAPTQDPARAGPRPSTRVPVPTTGRLDVRPRRSKGNEVSVVEGGLSRALGGPRIPDVGRRTSRTPTTVGIRRPLPHMVTTPTRRVDTPLGVRGCGMDCPGTVGEWVIEFLPGRSEPETWVEGGL